jgi:Ca2+-binding RTX toxin-like protein
MLCSSNLLSGGAGDDTYLIDNTSDAVLENANEGIDIVHATDHFRLSANVETLVLLPGSGNLAGIGNALANAIHGNSGDNSLDGGANADVLTGSLGNDTFMFNVGQADGDTVVDFAGNGTAAGDSLRFVGYDAAERIAGIEMGALHTTHCS